MIYFICILGCLHSLLISSVWFDLLYMASYGTPVLNGPQGPDGAMGPGVGQAGRARRVIRQVGPFSFDSSKRVWKTPTQDSLGASAWPPTS